MKKFAKTIFLYIIIVAALTACINETYKHLDRSDRQGIRKFETMPDDIAICNFGSSHGLYGFNYEDMDGVNCFNFALVSQYFSYDKRLFEYYRDHLAEGAVVFIPVSYFLFFGTGERNDPDFLSKNSRYYSILPAQMIKEYDVVTAIYEKWLPATTNPVNLARALSGKAKESDDSNMQSAVAGVDLKKNADAAYKRHIVTDKLDEAGNRIVNYEEINALKELIVLCQEGGYEPILVTTPFLKEYTDAIYRGDASFFEDFYRMVNEICDETGAAYYDYAFDERFIRNYEWFFDSDHLNREGARQFTNILVREVVHHGAPFHN